MKSVFFAIISILLLLTSCEKKLFNYRNKFIGKWHFKVDITELNTKYIGYFHHEIKEHGGKVSYGEHDEILDIEYLEGKHLSLEVDKNGELSKFPSSYSGGKFIGKDSLKFTIKWGGLGGGITHQVIGHKK